MRKIVFCLFIFISISCSFQKKEDLPEHLQNLENLIILPQEFEPEFSLNLIRETTFGDNNISKNWYDRFGGLGWFAGLEVDNEGRIFIGEYSNLTIHVFDADATYLVNLARRGRGPGELRSISDIRIIKNQLYIYDPLQFRLHAYSLDSLKLKKEENIYVNRIAEEIEELGLHHIHQTTTPMPGGTFIVGYMKHATDARVGRPTYNLDQERPIRYFLKNKEGKVISDHSFKLYDREVIVADVDGRHLSNTFALPFLGKPLLSISEKGNIYAAWSKDFLIKVYDTGGRYIQAFYFPLEKKKVRRGEIIERFDHGSETIQNLLLHAELPETWPALDDLFVDDESRLWVSTNIENEEWIREWWVLKNNGELIAKFKWPFNRTIKTVKNNKLYALETDTVTKEQRVVRYGIELSTK